MGASLNEKEHSNACYSYRQKTHDRWLAGEARKEILLLFPAEAMKVRGVSRRVNKPENNDPGLLEEGEMEQVDRLI
jgi:putative SOS response-associated peptidase YedK